MHRNKIRVLFLERICSLLVLKEQSDYKDVEDNTLRLSAKGIRIDAEKSGYVSNKM